MPTPLPKDPQGTVPRQLSSRSSQKRPSQYHETPLYWHSMQASVQSTGCPLGYWSDLARKFFPGKDNGDPLSLTDFQSVEYRRAVRGQREKLKRHKEGNHKIIKAYGAMNEPKLQSRKKICIEFEMSD